jgi:hypothetical protein
MTGGLLKHRIHLSKPQLLDIHDSRGAISPSAWY